MRTVLALALAAAVVTLAVSACGTGGQPGPGTAARKNAAAPAPDRPPAGGSPVWFQDLQMVSASDGWALVWSSDPSGSGSPVLEPAVTGDAGRTWTAVMPAAARALLENGTAVLDAVSAQQAYIAVNAADGSTTTVFGTADGGRSWTQSNPVAGAQTLALDVTGPGPGWLLATPGGAMGREPVTVWRTTDAGRAWAEVASDLPQDCDKTGMAFSGQTGWITAQCTLGYSVLVSRDGGVHWSGAQLPVPAGQCSQDGCVTAVPEVAGPTAFLEVESYPGAATLLVTRDDGATWQAEPMPGGAGPYPRLQFFGTAAAIAVSAGPQGAVGAEFYLTADGGRTWTAVPQGHSFAALGTGVDFVTPRAGFAWVTAGDAAGGAPPLLVTTDSGRAWTSVSARLVSAR